MKKNTSSNIEQANTAKTVREKQASKLKSLMALFSINQINLRSYQSSADIFEFGECLDRLENDIEPPTPELTTLAVEIVNAITKKTFAEIEHLEHGDGTAEIELDDSTLRVTIDIPYEDSKSSEMEDELDAAESPEFEIIEALSKLGVTKLTIDYSGSGDSGSFGEPQFFSEETLIPNASVDRDLITKIEDYLYEVSGADFNNDGSSGDAEIFLEDDAYHYRIDHRDYTTESHFIKEEF